MWLEILALYLISLAVYCFYYYVTYQPIKEVQVSSDMTVFSLSPMDTKCVYREIFEDKEYWRFGVRLRSAAEVAADRSLEKSPPRFPPVVFDIGANTGMFSMYLAKHYPHVRVYSFEPVPDIYRVCELNMIKHDTQQVVALKNLGVSCENVTAQFKYVPFVSLAAGMYDDDVSSPARKKGLLAFTRAMLIDAVRLKQFPQMIGKLLIFLLYVPVVNYGLFLLFFPILFWMLLFFKWRSYVWDKYIQCKLVKLDTFLAENQEFIEEIELMKIDVEGAEEDVLKGLSVQNAKKIKQMVLEVHDLNGRVDRIKNKLEKEYGFDQVHVVQDEWAVHELLNIYMIFAKRN